MSVNKTVKSKSVKQITYKVTGSFGDSLRGEERIAYLVGGIGDNESLAYHPKDTKYTCGSLELVRLDGDKKYVSAKKDYFSNLSASEDRNFRELVEKELGEIPKNLVIKKVDEEKTKWSVSQQMLIPVKDKPKTKKKLKMH
jgi:hypothetical protein